jgi:hypothetical protein
LGACHSGPLAELGAGFFDVIRYSDSTISLSIAPDQLAGRGAFRMEEWEGQNGTGALSRSTARAEGIRSAMQARPRPRSAPREALVPSRQVRGFPSVMTTSLSHLRIRESSRAPGRPEPDEAGGPRQADALRCGAALGRLPSLGNIGNAEEMTTWRNLRNRGHRRTGEHKRAHDLFSAGCRRTKTCHKGTPAPAENVGCPVLEIRVNGQSSISKSHSCKTFKRRVSLPVNSNRRHTGCHDDSSQCTHLPP